MVFRTMGVNKDVGVNGDHFSSRNSLSVSRSDTSTAGGLTPRTTGGSNSYFVLGLVAWHQLCPQSFFNKTGQGDAMFARSGFRLPQQLIIQIQRSLHPTGTMQDMVKPYMKPHTYGNDMAALFPHQG